MSEQTEVQVTTEQQVEPAQAQEAAAVQSIDSLPDWAKNAIKELRQENAKHRTEAKSAKDLARQQAEEQGNFQKLYEAEKAKAAELEQRAKAAEYARLRQAVVTKHQLPAVLADRLRGETGTEMEADAILLLDAIPKPAPLPTDGRAGMNGASPTRTKGDREIKEMAARLGVNYEFLKLQYQ